MNFLLTVVFAFFLVGNVAGACNDGCECPDFMSLREMFEDIDPDMFLTQHSACSANATCDGFTQIIAYWNETTIPRPGDSSTDYFLINTYDSWPPAPKDPIELFAFYGIVCEDKSWYATKYPYGIQYNNGGNAFTGYQEEYQEKKSKISEFYCRHY